MQNSKVLNGIVFFETPYEVNWVKFGYEHLDCDSIITKESLLRGEAEVEVICYSSSKEYNDKLRKLFNAKYNGKGYCYMQGTSSVKVELSSVWFK